MTEEVRMVTVDESNVEEEGFFCYKSKPKSEGYQKKLAWLKARMQEGLKIKIIYEGVRSMAFIEYIPGEYTWRVVDAPGYLVIHCLWVVGKGKGKGYGTHLLEACLQDAKEMDKLGVAMVSSRGNWLVDEKIFLKNGYELLDEAPPSFKLSVKKIKDGPDPTFPHDWDERSARYGQGMTVVYADQCPYVPDAVSHAREIFEKRGISTKTVKLENSAEVRQKSPSPYGIFGIVFNRKLFTYHYIGKKELRILDEQILS